MNGYLAQGHGFLTIENTGGDVARNWTAGQVDRLEKDYALVMEPEARKWVYYVMEEHMNADNRLSGFEPGQLWKTENGCILITSRGERIVSYRKLRNPEQRAALTSLIRPEALACYLTQVGAVLQP